MNDLPKSSKNNAGQALLLVLLSMAVVLTVALSITSRSVTDIKTTKYEEDTLRAFSAAEAGIEKTLLLQPLVSSSGTPDPKDTSVRFDSNVAYNSPGNSFEYPVYLSSGETATFWFVSHSSSNPNLLTCSVSDPCTRASHFEICWGAPAVGSPPPEEIPAIVISIYYDLTQLAVASVNNYSNISVLTSSYDPNDVRRPTNNFLFDAVDQSSSAAFRYCTGSINLATSYDSSTRPLAVGQPCATGVSSPGCLLMAKVKVLYNPITSPQPVAITVTGGGATLPSQGALVSSTGTKGEVKRKINVMQSYPVPPSPFENVLFSRTNLTK